MSSKTVTDVLISYNNFGRCSLDASPPVFFLSEGVFLETTTSNHSLNSIQRSVCISYSVSAFVFNSVTICISFMQVI